MKREEENFSLGLRKKFPLRRQRVRVIFGVEVGSGVLIEIMRLWSLESDMRSREGERESKKYVENLE